MDEPAGSVRRPGVHTGAMRGLARSGAALAAATLAANVLGYVLLLVLSRVLVAPDYGAVGALLNLAIVGAVPALAVQLVAARETARGRDPHSPPAPVARTSMLGRLGLGAGAVVGAAVVLASPLLDSYLHLGGPWAAVALGASLLPAGGTAAALGVLQGGERFGRLAALFVAVAVTRCVACTGAAVAGWGVTGVMAGTLAAAVAGLTVAVALVPPAFVPAKHAPVVVSPAGHRTGGTRAEGTAEARSRLRRDALASTLSTGGLLAFVNLDVLLARHYLPAAASGVYAVGSLFTKVTFWGPAFLATLLYPRMAGARGRDRAVAAAAGLTAALGAVVVLLALAAGRGLVTLTAGPRYADLGRTVALFAALGAAFAVVQVLIYARVAVGDRRLGIAAWLLAAATAVVVAVTSPTEVTPMVSIALGGACALVAVGFTLERGALRALLRSPGRRYRRRARARAAVSP